MSEFHFENGDGKLIPLAPESLACAEKILGRGFATAKTKDGKSVVFQKSKLRKVKNDRPQQTRG